MPDRFLVARRYFACQLDMGPPLPPSRSRTRFCRSRPYPVIANWILRNRTNDLNAIIALTGCQYRGIGVALVDQVLGREQVAAIERPMRYFDHIVVRRRRRSGFNVGNQTRKIVVAALCKVHFVANPRFPALGAEPRFMVLGGGKQSRWRGHLAKS